MIDTALLWIGLTMVVGVVSLGHLVRTYATSNEFHFGVFAVLVLCVAGVLELGTANGYLTATRVLNLVSGLSTAVAFVALVFAMWTGQGVRILPEDDP